MASRTRLSQQEAQALIQRPGPRGTTRQYVNPATGEVYSRRQAEQAQVAYGLRQKPAPMSHGMGRYGTLISERQKFEQGQGINRTRREIRNDQATKTAVAGLRTKNNTPGKPKAKALEYFGRRAAGATYNVGDTP